MKIISEKIDKHSMPINLALCLVFLVGIVLLFINNNSMIGCVLVSISIITWLCCMVTLVAVKR